MADMKICKRCFLEKTESEFYESNPGTCKVCIRISVNERYNRLMATDPEWAVKEMDRQLKKERKRRADGKIRKETLEESRIRLLRYRGKNELRRKAHNATSRAISEGLLKKQPCEVCQYPIVEAHHDDYSKPLEVRWLCVKHHNEHHVQERRKAILARLQSQTTGTSKESKPHYLTAGGW